MGALALVEIGKILANKLPTIMGFLLQLPVVLGAMTLGVTLYITLSALVVDLTNLISSITSDYPFVWCMAQAMGVQALMNAFVSTMTLFITVSFFLLGTVLAAQIKTASLELVKL